MSAVTPFPVDQSARAVHRRLWNPPNGRESSELEIMGLPAARRARIAAVPTRSELRERRYREVLERAMSIPLHQPKPVESGRSGINGNIVDVGYIPNLNEIVTIVANWFEVTKLDMISHRRTHNVAVPRHIACYLARHMTALSLPQIGRYFGGRDHTTIRASVITATKHYQSNLAFRETVEAIRAAILAQ